MYYSDLKQSLVNVITVDWPKAPTANTTYQLIDPDLVPLSQHIAISDLQSGLSGWLHDDPITTLIASLPSELKVLIHQLQQELQVNKFAFNTGAGEDETVLINGFSFAFSVHFDDPPTVCGIQLKEIGLELNFVILGKKLSWKPLLLASCTFLDVSCGLSIGLLSPTITIVASEVEGININSVLQAASGDASITLSSLQSNMSISGDLPKVEMFEASAELSSKPSFSCLIALDTPNWTWKGCALTEVGIALKYGHDDTSVSFDAQLEMGGINIDVLIAYSTQLGTTVTGSISTQGSTLSDFLDSMASALGFTNPMPGIHEIALTGLSFSITDNKGLITFDMSCNGAIAFDDTGTSLQFAFSFHKESGNSITVTLQLGTLQFKLSENKGQYVFATSAAAKISLNDLVHLAQLYPLYGVTSGLDVTLTSGLLVLVPNEPNGNHILCALQFTTDSLSLKNDLIQMIMGKDELGISAFTIMAANQAWTIEQLSVVDNSPIALTKPVEQGLSCIPTLVVGENHITAPLSPANTNNSSQGQDPSKSASSSNPGTWFNVQKQIGPVYLNRVGLGFENSGTNGISVVIQADASFTLGPTTVSLQGFSIDIPFKKLSEPSVGLQGLDICYDKSPLLISGGFLNQGNNLYIGEVQVETKTFFLSALGEYAHRDNYTSLALFAALTDPPLGGPVFCYITGFAAGFGYNSALQIPTRAAEVAQFPLVTAASSGEHIKDPFKVIQDCIQPQQNEDWVAVGIIFRSFELIQSTALLTAAFGDKLQFAVLAQSEMSIPPASETRIAYAQVDIEAEYIPDSGALVVEGILTPNSYVFSKDCHIQGGFIFVLKENGDFIVSFGGYAADFDYVSHGYPAVQRLGLVWNVDSHTSIKGAEYFALTPAAMMAGGALQAIWNSGIFSAWFNVSIDILIQWRPFYYEATFSMSLGVGFDLNVACVSVHFTFEIGAQLTIAGPPFHGHAHIDLDVISFDLDFGLPAEQPKPLLWTEFRDMLPGNPNNDKNSDLLTVKITDGLQKDLSQENSSISAKSIKDDNQPDWIVNGTNFSFNIQSSLPITTAATGNVTVSIEPKQVVIGILPMDVPSASGLLEVVIKAPNGEVVIASPALTSKVVVSTINTEMASAHWGTEKPKNPNAKPVNCTSGYIVSAGSPIADCTCPIDLGVLLADSVSITSISDRNASSNPFTL